MSLTGQRGDPKREYFDLNFVTAFSDLVFSLTSSLVYGCLMRQRALNLKFITMATLFWLR